MKSLDRNIWRSSISLQTKIRLYNVYILQILLYGADKWNMTVASSRRLDAFDQWCLRRIVHIPYTAHITNEEVRRRTGQPQSPQLSQRDDFVCSDILREPTHHKTTRAFFEQPLIVLQWIGNTGQVDQGGHGSAQYSLTFGPITLVLTQRGSVRRIVQSGVSLWRRLCSLMGMLLDDGDEFNNY